MSTRTKSRLLLAGCALGLLLAFPITARATLTYVKYGRYPLQPVVFAADDDGSNAHPVGKGQAPLVSPDESLIAYRNEAVPGGWKRLKVVSVNGGVSNLLIDASRISDVVWSPTSKTIAAVRGSRRGWDKLVLIEVPSGGQHVVDIGYFGNVSFSPDGSELVYSRTGSRQSPPRSDIFRTSVFGGPSARLTYDRRSQDPLWGPDGEIVFVRQGRRRRKSDLFLMNPQGGQVRRVTRTHRRHGFFPIDWSGDGDRLLTEFRRRHRRPSYVVFDLPADRKWTVRQRGMRGFAAASLSDDGELVLGSNGSPDPVAKHLVGTLPAAGGGSMHVLGEFAYEPSWSQ